jgi:hypothetical protein
MGALQNPAESRLFIGTSMNPVPIRSYVPLYDTPNNKRGYFVYDPYHFVVGRAVYFQFGSSGYSKIMICNSTPNFNSPTTSGISVNLGPLSFSIGTNTTPNYSMNTSYTNPTTSYTSPTTSYTSPTTGYNNPTMNYGMNSSMNMGMNSSMGMNNSMNMGMNNSMNMGINPSFGGYVNVNRGENIGRRHMDTRSFDHFNLIPKTHAPVRQINVWGSSRVNGIQVIYDGGCITPLEIGYHDNPVQQSLILAQGEFITEVSGTQGEVIESLEIKTNYGKFLRVGGYSGNPFRFSIPYGTQIVGFYGGIGGHIHNLGVYYV